MKKSLSGFISYDTVPSKSSGSMPLRQTTEFGQSLLQLMGLDWPVPEFSILFRRQKTLNVNLPYRGGAGPLNLLIASTGIKAKCEGD